MTLSSTAIQSAATAGSLKSMGRLRVALSILGSPKRVDALTKAANRVKSIHVQCRAASEISLVARPCDVRVVPAAARREGEGIDRERFCAFFIRPL